MRKEVRPEHKELLIRIGERVKELRNEKKLSYEAMAKEIGIPRNTYNLLENGRHSFQITTLLLVLQYHQITLSNFFKDIENL